MKVLDQAQTGAVAGSRGRADLPVVLIAATTGLRRGEILGLRWHDLDLDQGMLSVACTLEETKAEGLVFKEPKTARSRRRLPLVPFTIELLRLHRARQGEERLRAGSMWLDTDLVLPSGRRAACAHAESPRPSPPWRGAQASIFTCIVCAIPISATCSLPASTSRSSASAPATPRWSSPWTDTATYCRECSRTQSIGLTQPFGRT